MTAFQILIIYLILFSVEFIFSYFLSILNINSTIKNRGVIPKPFDSIIDSKTYRNMSLYTQEKGVFSLIEHSLSSIFLLFVILSGLLGKIDQKLLILLGDTKLFQICFIAVVSAIFSFVSLPLSLYEQFIIEEKYGFNKTSASLYLSDALKSTILSIILGVPLFLGLLFFMEKTGELWWLYGSLFFFAFQVIIMLIYPVFIAPLFNKFSPLEEGELKERLLQLAEKTGFSTSGIYIMDGSKRSGHSNAYFTGFGKFKRIVLFDTLIDSLSPEQVEGVLAHEIGHYKKKHILKRVILSFFSLTFALFLIHLCLNWTALYQAFGLTRPSFAGLLIILGFASSPFNFFLTPLSNYWSRKHEYEADRYAGEICKTVEPLKQGLLTLGKENLSNLTPHKAYSFFHYSHPALKERLEGLDLVAQSIKEKP